MRGKSVVFVVVVSLAVMLSAASATAQTETATVSGHIVDSFGGIVQGADVQLLSIERGTVATTATNDSGIYLFVGVRPGKYQLTVRMAGFKQVDFLDFVVNVQDHIEQNFRLQVGSVSESVTVEGNLPIIDTQDATVSTLIDRQFVENLPINGRSFQTLIDLTPGVVLTPSTFSDPGQFSVNGQRASSNYFTVDGVSANVGVGPFGGLSQTAGGSIPSFNAVGGTNSLVSEDSLQEFRIQTSTFAPEFGRTPGAQVSLSTRSGTNSFHGTLFEYLRNDKLDANDWFSNQDGLPKSEERINDFGGAGGGPIVKDKTFFFVSYEGQRLRLPATAVTTVPSVDDRENAPPAIQTILDAYPLPTPGLDGNEFVAGYSNRASLDAGSIRIDHTLTSRISLFGRYDYAQSSSLTRGGANQVALSTLEPVNINTQTLTIGSTFAISAHTTNDFRFNYSRSSAASSDYVDSFGGAIPPPASLFPDGFNPQNAHIEYTIDSLQNSIWSIGRVAANLQRQYNIVDSFAIQKGSHSLKFGVDFRRLTPELNPDSYVQFVDFPDIPSALASSPLVAEVSAEKSGTILFRNLGLFAQDTWKINPRLTLTYGLRWDTDFVPHTIDGPPLSAAVNFNNPSTLALAPSGTPIFHAEYDGFAPRVGIAYELRSKPGGETIVRAGFGLFNDLRTQEVGDAMLGPFYPYGALNLAFFPAYPLTPAVTTPPPFACNSSNCELALFNPNLVMPRTYQWNVTVQQSLGSQQALSVAYLGAVGRDLLQQNVISNPNPNFGFVEMVGNAATSSYNAMQVQFQRRLFQGVQALASYTWSHSIDDASSSSIGSPSNAFGDFGAEENRGSSDFDIRHSFSAAVTFNIPTPATKNVFARSVLGGWSLDSIVIARSAPPVNVYYSELSFSLLNQAAVRPDVVEPRVPFYLTDPSAAGGRIINANAFQPPPIDPSDELPLRQGNLPRNALRGFGATQWDDDVRREFVLHENVTLQFKAEFFNILNHANFALPNSDLDGGFFGQSTSTLSNGLGSNVAGSGGFGFASVFELGGPRSIQFSLKLQF